MPSAVASSCAAGPVRSAASGTQGTSPAAPASAQPPGSRRGGLRCAAQRAAFCQVMAHIRRLLLDLLVKCADPGLHRRRIAVVPRDQPHRAWPCARGAVIPGGREPLAQHLPALRVVLRDLGNLDRHQPVHPGVVQGLIIIVRLAPCPVVRPPHSTRIFGAANPLGAPMTSMSPRYDDFSALSFNRTRRRRRYYIPSHGNQNSEWDAGRRFDFANPEHR